MTSRTFVSFILAALFLIHTGLNIAYAASVGVKKILVLPPVVHSSEDMEFLQKGIVDMLTSRLAGDSQIVVNIADSQKADKQVQALNHSAAAALGKEAGADFVLSISLTVIGNSASTDAQVIDVADGSTVLTFGQAGQNQSDVIAHIDQLAAQMKSRLLGVSAPIDATQKPSAQAQISSDKPKAAPESNQHPEKMLVQPESGQQQPSWDFGPGRQASAELLMRSGAWDAQIRGVTAGDVDGDGNPDVVCIDAQTIFVYRIEKGRFVKLADLDEGINNVAVDAVDVNGNGIAEIFVTHFDNERNRVGSFVMEWDGRNFKRTAERMNWFFRALNWPGRGKIIAGQRQGVDDLFSPGIYEVNWQNGQYESGERLSLPKSVDIFGFAYGPVRTAADNEIVSYDSSGNVRILNQRGKEEWISSEPYGGGAEFLQVKDNEDPRESTKKFIPPRIHLSDVNDDGVQEVFVLRNKDSAAAFGQTRMFKNGRLEALGWDQLGLAPVWQTREVSKYFSDFTLADLDGDERLEVIAVVVQKTSHALNKGSSYLAVFTLANSKSDVQQ